MNSYIALLRAVNVGGTGKLPMAELRALCEDIGFENVRTYIASGNVIFSSTLSAAKVKKSLQDALQRHAGKPVGVIIRSGEELAAVLAANPFPDAAPNHCVAIFLDRAPGADALDDASGRGNEQMKLGKREIYVCYGDGIADSKLKIPAARSGTARNMNTIARLVQMASDRA